MTIVKNIPILLFTFFTACTHLQPVEKIDRKALVERHIVNITTVDSVSSLTVGNGGFAFTVDFTGLQTYPELYENGIPLGSYSNWGWHSFPNIHNYNINECLKNYNYHGRKVSYNVEWNNTSRKEAAADYFRQNPHRVHLGMLGLDLIHPDGSPVNPRDIDFVSQSLNPWSGKIESAFIAEGYAVKVITYAHQEMDVVSAKIVSPLISKGLLRVRIRFPYPSGQHTDEGCDWTRPERHISLPRYATDTSVIINRRMDSTFYSANLAWKGKARLLKNAAHDFIIVPDSLRDSFTISCLFSPEVTETSVPDFETTERNNRVLWEAFWSAGGAVDFSGSTDPRAAELERRVVLSQYLTKIQCSGILPPQETGLTYNSSYGKFHLEMHWWQSAHFALWQRTALLEKSLGYYLRISENAFNTADRQGFRGYRWPKMTDPYGNDSPSDIGSFLIWQQPHVIYLAELCYRSKPDVETVRKYAGLVFATADFMASYAWRDRVNNRFVLGPTLIPAQERYPPETTLNPSFELAYWYYGLATAQKWRERLGIQRNQEWDSVLVQLSPLPKSGNIYLATETAPDSYTNPRFLTDHPVVLAAYGMLPQSRLVDTAVMRKTFDFVWNNWNWNETRGWDFPMVAMAATRLGMPEKAVDALFMKTGSNTWLPNGHNYQNDRLRVYLPGNGGLLTAIAIMCAGFDNSRTDLPGFPKNGTWKVRYEGINKLP
ncbi:MAG TPA: hypothetical protein VK179_12595 [Bacteroidales bacterium]|nr:hypothetical protein [Bacteroidales bacterium]